MDSLRNAINIMSDIEYEPSIPDGLTMDDTHRLYTLARVCGVDRHDIIEKQNDELQKQNIELQKQNTELQNQLRKFINGLAWTINIITLVCFIWENPEYLVQEMLVHLAISD